MLRLSYLLFLTIFCNTVIAQNLVPNPSFEDTVSCPELGGQVTRAKFWIPVLNTPDYFHECCPYPQHSVPENYFGYQPSCNGNAYIGLITYYTSWIYGEAIGTNLISPLVIGQKYFIDFKVNLAFNPNQVGSSNLATDKIGILFSTNSYSLSNSPPINNFAHVYSDSIITDTINWVTIKGSFIADSAYTFISLGVFFDYSHIDTIHIANSNGYQSYYYVDCICVSTDSLFCDLWTSDLENQTRHQTIIFPNPSSGSFWIDGLPTNTDVIEIYNEFSQKVFSKINITQQKLHLNLNHLASGLYYLIVKSNNTISKFKLIINKN